MASNADSHNSSSTSFITHLVDSSHLKTVPSKFKFINDPSGLTLDSLPVVDFSAFTGGDPDRRSKAIHDLAKACEEWGFFIVVNHGIPEALMNATFAAVLPKNTNESRIKEKSDIFSWSILDDLFAKFCEIEQTSPYISIELLSTTFPMISASVYFVYVPWFPWILHVHQPNSCFPWFPLRPTFRGTFAVHEILSSTKQLKNCGTERSEFAW